jgi:hypothetical protein
MLMGTPAGVSKDRLYLCRNTGRSRGATADQDEKLLETFAQVVVNNGLECKVACSNSKVSMKPPCLLEVCWVNLAFVVQGVIHWQLFNLGCRGGLLRIAPSVFAWTDSCADIWAVC